MSNAITSRDFAQPYINRIASASRAANDNSEQNNNLKEQLISLMLQIDDKDIQIKELRFALRSAKRANSFSMVQEFEALILQQKFLLKSLKNTRNRLRNKIFSLAKVDTASIEAQSKIARLRTMRHERDRKLAA